MCETGIPCKREKKNRLRKRRFLIERKILTGEREREKSRERERERIKNSPLSIGLYILCIRDPGNNTKQEQIERTGFLPNILSPLSP